MSMENKNDMMNKIITWIERNVEPEMCTSEQFIYNDLESQSGFSLPIIYQPFDGTKKSHWVERGRIFDYLYSTDGEGKRLLDFGPGDGWPSLLVAPYVKEVIGLDASIKRVEICRKNANQIGITNAQFKNYSAGMVLPFPDNTFDGVMAASSVEQTPNPKETLKELFRVLKPGGKLRIFYEALNCYKNGEEQDLWIAGLDERISKLILFNRNIQEENTVQYGIKLAIPRHELREMLMEGNKVNFNNVTIPFLEKIKSKIVQIQICKTVHPSGKTLVSWLTEIGFNKIIPSYNGGIAALKLFNQYCDTDRPTDQDSIDKIIKKVVKVVIELRAPIEIDPMITAIK